MERGIAHLAQIVRRDVGRHADGDAARPVAQQVGNGPRQHRRLVFGAVVIGAEIDRVLVDPFEQGERVARQPRLGIAHRRRAIAVDIAEIPLTLDQRVAHREILRHPHHRVVDRLVAMRVELAHHVADHPGAFLESGIGIEPELAHREQEPPMHRFQPVAHVGERPRGNRRQRVGEVALAQRLGQRDLACRGFEQIGLVGHRTPAGNRTMAS